MLYYLQVEMFEEAYGWCQIFDLCFDPTTGFWQVPLGKQSTHFSTYSRAPREATVSSEPFLGCDWHPVCFTGKGNRFLRTWRVLCYI